MNLLLEQIGKTHRILRTQLNRKQANEILHETLFWKQIQEALN